VLYVGDHLYGDMLQSKKVREVAAGVSVTSTIISWVPCIGGVCVRAVKCCT
jgi:hypothetical protein